MLTAGGKVEVRTPKAVPKNNVKNYPPANGTCERFQATEVDNPTSDVTRVQLHGFGQVAAE